MAVKQKSLFRRIIGWLHLWIGLISGLIVFIVSITGCLFVFQEEISNLYYQKTFFIQKEAGPVLPLHVLKEKAQQVLGSSQPVEYITVYADDHRAWEFMAYKENDTALTYFGALEHFHSVFVNPYTGEVTGTRNYRLDFFTIVKYLHWSLLLSTPYGQPIVGWCTLVFVLMLLTGLVLWYPKKWNRTTRQQAFKIKWKAGLKRLNYDLHNVPGFYSMLPALVLALTGMVFSFGWFEKAVYAVAAGSLSAPVVKELKSFPLAPDSAIHPLDIAFSSAVSKVKNAKRFLITLAAGRDGTLNMYAYHKNGVYYDYDELRYDQYSGELLNYKKHSEKNRGEKIVGMNYDIHVGAIGGITGKIIAFIVSLICASLPVTGFLVWFNKRKKSKNSVVSAGV